MDTTSRVKLIIIGLVLAAIVVGYFILAQRFEGTKVSTNQNQAVTQQTPRASASSGAVTLSSPTPIGTPSVLGQNNRTSAPMAQSNQSASNQNLSNLPNTGIPASLAAIFSVSAVVSGYFLRKFPN